MARRARNRIDITAFKKFIAFIKKDLGLQDLDIVVHFRHMAKSSGVVYHGYMYRGRNIDSYVIIHPDPDIKEIAKTIAHELRHIWQRNIARCYDEILHDDNEWYNTWYDQSGQIVYQCTNTELSTIYKRNTTEYDSLPWESDAREYEIEALQKWYAHKGDHYIL